MIAQIRILGVHPIKADEPVHSIELVVEGSVEDFDFGEVTQEVAGESRDNWQVPYDERLLERSEGRLRYSFFFHYLDLQKTLTTPIGGRGYHRQLMFRSTSKNLRTSDRNQIGEENCLETFRFFFEQGERPR